MYIFFCWSPINTWCFFSLDIGDVYFSYVWDEIYAWLLLISGLSQGNQIRVPTACIHCFQLYHAVLNETSTFYDVTWQSTNGLLYVVSCKHLIKERHFLKTIPFQTLMYISLLPKDSIWGVSHYNEDNVHCFRVGWNHGYHPMYLIRLGIYWQQWVKAEESRYRCFLFKQQHTHTHISTMSWSGSYAQNYMIDQNKLVQAEQEYDQFIELYKRY